MARGLVFRRIAAAFLLALGWAGSAAADCPVGGSPVNRPNIILFVIDDLWWADLPHFSPPIVLTTGTTTTTTLPSRVPSWRIQRPDLNRLAARIFAGKWGALGTFGSANPVVPFDVTRPVPSPWYNPRNDGTCSNSSSTLCKKNSDCPVVGCTGGTCIIPASDCDDAACRCDGDDQDCDCECSNKTDVLREFGGLGRLTTNGAWFPRYSSPTTFCEPSRSTIMTGRHTFRTGIGANGAKAMPASEVTIPEWLQQGCPNPQNPSQADPARCHLLNGGCTLSMPCYRTALVGKWNLGHGTGTKSWDQGFDDVIESAAIRGYTSGRDLKCHGALLGGADLGCTDETFEFKGKTDRKSEWACSNDSEDNTPPTDPPGGENVCRYSTRMFAKLANKYIDKWKADYTNNSRPFFLMVSLNALHSPHSAPSRTKAHYTNLPHLNPRGRERLKTYWAALEEIAAAVGKILTKLDEVPDPSAGGAGRKIRKNTVVLVTGDHGAPHGNYGSPVLKSGKGSNYEGGTRVGLLASACDEAPLAPIDSTLIANHTDLFPTIAEAAGVPVKTDAPTDPSPYNPAQKIDGKSFYKTLLPAGSGSSTPHRNYTFSRYKTLSVSRRQTIYGADSPAYGVCGYTRTREDGITLRAGSCQICDSDDDCEDDVFCRVLGRVCVNDTTHGPGMCQGCTVTAEEDCECNKNSQCASGWCTYDYYSTHQDELLPCVRETDCPGSGYSCRDISIPCPPPSGAKCIEPSWKLYVKNLQGANTAYKLFDLATNPEEDGGLDCLKFPGDATSATKIGTLTTDLLCRANRWEGCTNNDTAPENDCDYCLNTLATCSGSSCPP